MANSCLAVWISEMKLDDFYHSGFSDYCLHLYCYIHNFSAGVLQPSLGISCRTRKPTRNFEPRPLSNPIIHIMWKKESFVAYNIDQKPLVAILRHIMISLRHNLHCNNYPESLTSAPRNLDRTIENDTQNLITVCLSCFKGLAERIQKICCPYDIRTI